jgi:SSS family solute:Na+ symporter
MSWGLVMLYNIPNPASGRQHFGGSALALNKLSLLGWHPFPGSPMQIYVGFVALIGNLVAAIPMTITLRKLHIFNGTDETNPSDYLQDEGSPRLRPVPSPLR